MPELPEVEMVRRGLAAVLPGRRISALDIYWAPIIQLANDQSLNDWQADLVGQTVRSVGRRGKYLLLELDQGQIILHLRMEGKCYHYLEEEVPAIKPKHAHVIWHFEDGSQFHFEDVRKFGRMTYCRLGEEDAYFANKGLGPGPLGDDFRLKDFQEALARSSRAIKPLLLDQKLVVGLGNIYVDEVCFHAGIHPASQAKALSPQQSQQLYQSICTILAAALEAGGSTIRSYRNTLGEAGHYQQALKVYGRQGRACLRCGHLLVKQALAGCGTHWCPHCQPLIGAKGGNQDA